MLAVVGAAGNVGRTCAEILARGYKRTVLIGSGKPGSQSRLKRLATRIPHAEIATELSAVGAADTVIVAVNAVEPLLGPDHFARNAIVCDVSVPSAVRPDTGALRPDLFIIQGGIVRLPFGEDVGIFGFPLPVGHVYGCMAEGIILGFEGMRDMSFTGSLTSARVRFIEEKAGRHGFELADFGCVSPAAANPPEEVYVYAR